MHSKAYLAAFEANHPKIATRLNEVAKEVFFESYNETVKAIGASIVEEPAPLQFDADSAELEITLCIPTSLDAEYFELGSLSDLIVRGTAADEREDMIAALERTIAALRAATVNP